MGPSWYWMPDIYDSVFARFGYNRSELYNLTLLDPSYKLFYNSNTIEVPFLKRLLSCHLIQNKKLPKNRKPSLPERLSPPYRNNQFLNPK
jgi:hypothetical protein